MTQRRTRSAPATLAFVLFGVVGGVAVGCADGSPRGINGPAEVGTVVVGSTVAADSVAESTAPVSPEPGVVTTPVSDPSPTSAVDLPPDADVQHRYPLDPSVNSSYATTHSNYPATDIFADCGSPIIAPVDGIVDDLRTVNAYDPTVDDPSTRGGIYVSMLGDDGARYYMAHLSTVDSAIAPGARLNAGDPVGAVGTTGRAGACHLHFALSPPCATAPGAAEGEWWVRRGVIWPSAYLDDWRNGGNLSPAAETSQWLADHPDACTSIENTPFPIG